jgi:ADP-ribose pyrophosphatase YjhB (NUDIX family)
VLHLIERLLPAPLHRVGLRAAHRLRKVIRRVFKRHVTGITLIGTNAEGHVLLVRHSYGSRQWTLPGGKVERGEEPPAAARRELREELRCEAERLAFATAIEDDLWGAPHSDLLFTCELKGMPLPDGREVVEAKFFPPDHLPPDLTPRAARQLALAQENAR